MSSHLLTAKIQGQLAIRLARVAAAAKLLQSCPTLCDPIDGKGLHLEFREQITIGEENNFFLPPF